MDALRHPPKIATTPTVPVAGKQPAKRKTRRQANRKRAAVSAALALMLILLAGCTFHRTTSLDLGPLHRETAVELNCDPRPAFELPQAQPTES